jgi:hypothetical protein
VRNAGTVAGVVGGTLMALLASLDADIAGVGFWIPMRFVAVTVLGPNAFVGVGAVVLGVLIHFGMSIVWGVLFALSVPRETKHPLAIMYGLFASVVILLIMTFLVLPWADPMLRALAQAKWLAWVIDHLVFGLGLASAPALRRYFARRSAQLRGA